MYEILYTPDVLHRAFNRAMRGHRNDAEHAAAEAHKIETIEYLARQLRRETYEPRPLRQFWVTEPKRRQIQAPCVMDKIVQNALVDGLLYDWLTKPFIRDCYSSVNGRGTSDGLARLKLFMGEYYRCHGAEGWVLKCDIHHYFDSIDQSDVLRRASGTCRTRVLWHCLPSMYGLHRTDYLSGCVHRSLWQTLNYVKSTTA